MKSKIKQVKIDQRKEKIHSEAFPEMRLGFVDVPGKKKLVDHIKPEDEMNQYFKFFLHS
jgi:hypothetical protein